MQAHHHTDTDFDAFRRERKRVCSKLRTGTASNGYENRALRELEEVEAKEVHEQQLSREVHDFFAAATRQAAEIVEKVSHDAVEQAGERLQNEVDEFLLGTMTRMNSFILSVMQQRRNINVAETQIEPDVKHLVGHELDEFRHTGNTLERDVHIGRDPFATAVEDVQREFRAVVDEMDVQEQDSEPIQSSLVTQVWIESLEQGDEAIPEDNESSSTNAESPEQIFEESGDLATFEDRDIDEDVEAPIQTSLSSGDNSSETHSEFSQPQQKSLTCEQELETFRSALKALVRQGVMQRNEASAAYSARLSAIARSEG
jgi:hypothetical protein